MLKLKRTDSEVAEAVFQKTETHKWYLKQEFALFSNMMSDKEKQDNVTKLCVAENPGSFTQGEPPVSGSNMQDHNGRSDWSGISLSA